MKRLLYLASCLVIVGFSSQAMAQNCDLILRDGIHDSYSKSLSSQERMEYHRNMCSTYKLMRGNVSGGGQSVEVGIKGLNVGFGQTHNRQSVFDYGKSLCESRSGNNYSSNDMSVIRNIANPSVLSAFNTCVSASKKSIDYTIRTENDGRVKVLDIKIKMQTGMQRPVFHGIKVEPANALKCSWNRKAGVPVGSKLTNEHYALLCKRTGPITRAAMANIAFSTIPSISISFPSIKKLTDEKYRSLNNKLRALERQHANTLKSQARRIKASEGALASIKAGRTVVPVCTSAKTASVAGRVNIKDVQGPHCVMKSSTRCPRGYRESEIKIDAEDDDKRPVVTRVTGSPGASHKTRSHNVVLKFCCK